MLRAEAVSQTFTWYCFVTAFGTMRSIGERGNPFYGWLPFFFVLLVLAGMVRLLRAMQLHGLKGMDQLQRQYYLQNGYFALWSGLSLVILAAIFFAIRVPLIVVWLLSSGVILISIAAVVILKLGVRHRVR